MKKINNLITELKHYFIHYQSFILYSIILSGLLLFASSLPYINLFLVEDNLIIFMIVVFWIISVVLFQFSYKVCFVLAIIVCLPAYILLLADIQPLAEIIGDVIYILFTTGVLQMIVSQFNKKKLAQGD